MDSYKIKYTDYIKTKYKGKYYYIRGWIEYMLIETNKTKGITYRAGFQTKKRKCSLKPIKMEVSDSFGNKKSVSRAWNGANGERIAYTNTTNWTWDKTDENQNISVNILGTFDKTRFSGKKVKATLNIIIPALNKPQVSLVVTRENATTAKLELTAVCRGECVIPEPTITKNSVAESLTWYVDGTAVSFPYTAQAGTTVFTATSVIDEMHSFDFAMSGDFGGFAYEDASSIDYTYFPEWTQTISVNDTVPYINNLGKAQIEVWAKDYSQNALTLLPNDDGWDITITDSTHWSIELKLSEQYIQDPTSHTSVAEVQILYKTYTSAAIDDKIAIFSTNRNANFSTGLANNVFIGGCSVADYSSRVWYSAVNNPLYMPDLNYIEVGSNDTRVMGLVKVGDYLGVVKQSKSVDASVFLVYPTSFEDETTFATKACVSGVGALSQYCFNVLGDETLFLSPRGVMAIEPYEDEQSRVKNRSYFVDGRLLEEVGLEKAYSFVWNGLYLLAVNNHVYVLDGNQRNSWGNQKTNLVYECYYLDNVPAKVMFSYDGELWFADFDGNICRFKNSTEEDAYTDDGEPVVANWSTIADDDGAVQYYKTLQKKGNVVSLLPEEGTSASVYLKRDEDDMMLITENPPIEKGITLPPSVYVRKKVKKYKRLQFFVEDVTDKPFGLNKIVKSYVVGNYAKK